MITTEMEKYNKSMDCKQREMNLRTLVISGTDQAKQGNVKEIDKVFERLEKKYKSAIL